MMQLWRGKERGGDINKGRKFWVVSHRYSAHTHTLRTGNFEFSVHEAKKKRHLLKQLLCEDVFGELFVAWYDVHDPAWLQTQHLGMLRRFDMHRVVRGFNRAKNLKDLEQNSIERCSHKKGFTKKPILRLDCVLNCQNASLGH